MVACKNLSKNELDNSSDTAREFFYFVQSFGNKLKVCDSVNLWLLEDQIQELESVTRGIFQIYFYDNLYNPDGNSKILHKKKLTKATVETLLNKLFVLGDKNKNEETIEQQARQQNITIT